MRRGRLWRVALESCFLQSLFAPERRQGPGVAAALSWVEDDSGAPLPAERLAAHSEGFNTNPAMAGPVLGALARMESSLVPGDEAGASRIARFKRACEAPFAAAGDLVLWRGLRGGGGVAGAALALAAGAWGPASFLLLYNAGHLGLRLGGVMWGYGQGERAAGLLRSPRFLAFRRLAWWLARLAPITVAVAVVRASEPGPVTLGVAAAAAGYGLARGPASGGLVLGGAMIAGLIAARMWG